MQWRLPPPSEQAEWLLRWMMRRGFPVLTFLAPRLPRWALILGARFIMTVVKVIYPGLRRAAAGNLSRVMERPLDSPEVRKATRRLMVSFGMSWADLFGFGQLNREQILALVVDREGVDRLDAVFARGKGAVLLTAHLGPWEVGAVILRNLGLPVSIVYVPDRFEDAERFRSTMRRGRDGDVEEIALDLDDQFSTLPALRALTAGRLLAMQGDRDFNNRGTLVPFFGVPVRFPPGPLLLARMTGVPVVPAFVVYRDDFRLAVEVGEPFEVPRTNNREADLAAALARWVGLLEEAVRRHPSQWFTFYDIFADGSVPDTSEEGKVGA